MPSNDFNLLLFSQNNLKQALYIVVLVGIVLVNNINHFLKCFKTVFSLMFFKSFNMYKS